MSPLRPTVLTGALLLLALPLTARAYNLDTVTSESCHERITTEALDQLVGIIDQAPGLTVPDDSLVRRLLANVALPGTENLGEEARYFLLSIIVGVRSPDTEGHSTLNLGALRRVHADPDARGQYAHALRGLADDGVAGDLTAIEGTRAVIRDELMAAAAAFQTRMLVEKPFFVDHYGQVDVLVSLSAWHLGRALHAMQDAHAHMLWNEDVSHVVHVLNYVDAVDGTLKASRDGLAHSGALDECDRDSVQPMVERARGRSRALTQAMAAFLLRGDMAPFERGIAECDDMATDPDLCGWLIYNPPCEAAIEAGDEAMMAQVCCDASNAYCESPYLSTAKQKPAGPYLGCVARPGGGGPAGALALLLVLGCLVRRRSALVVATLAALLGASPAEADDDGPRAFVTLEGHGSALDDTANGALLVPTFGAGVRAGWRWGRWRAGLHVERNWWVPVEFGVAVDEGALNIAAVGEALWFDGFVRSSVALGASILMYDTVLDDAGTTGPFFELRPAGLRWAVGGGVHLVFDPLSVAVIYPVVSDPPLRKIERRTLLGVESTFL